MAWFRRGHSSAIGARSVERNIVGLMPYLSMASMASGTYRVESSMVWVTAARALLRYLVLPMKRTFPAVSVEKSRRVKSIGLFGESKGQYIGSSGDGDE